MMTNDERLATCIIIISGLFGELMGYIVWNFAKKYIWNKYSRNIQNIAFILHILIGCILGNTPMVMLIASIKTFSVVLPISEGPFDYILERSIDIWSFSCIITFFYFIWLIIKICKTPKNNKLK